MSVENARKFIQFMAKECGKFTQDQFKQALSDLQQGTENELSAEELNTVTGGASRWSDKYPYMN